MKTQKTSLGAGLAALPLCVLSLAVSTSILAQDDVQIEIEIAPIQIENPAEEVLVLGRARSAAQDLVLERQEADSVVDFLGADQIARVGDPNVADSLRRVPGLSLVDGKFIYIRGLGERYSNVTLNGAAVPSPDLTRNVLPLDIFPSAIVEALSVQKGYSADKAATFSGGAIDIRTNSIPDGFVGFVQASGGLNSLSDTHVDYPGGDNFGDEDGTRPLPASVTNALFSNFQNGDDFDLNPFAIRDTAARNGNPISLQQAEAINRELATDFNRNLDIRETDSTIQDFSLGGGIGNSFELGNNFVFGVLGSANYSESIRTQERIQRNEEDPTLEFTEETKSTQNASLTITLAAALKWGEDHTIETKNFFIRNTDDEAFLGNRFSENNQFGQGGGLRDLEGIFEQRELEISQYLGRHVLGDETLDLLGLGDSFLNNIELNWFFSESDASTEIPAAFRTTGAFDQDPDTLEISNLNIILGGNVNSGLIFEDTRLDDELESSGFDIKLPFDIGDFGIELQGGARTDRRARLSEQFNFNIDSTVTSTDVAGTISERFSDEAILDPANGFSLDTLATDFTPALAATQTDSVFGQIKFDWNETISAVIGARYEDYRQLSAELNLLARPGSGTPVLPNLDLSDLNEDGFPQGVFQDDQLYPSASIKYTRQYFWAETFNLHFGVSETTVRPDLREITDTSFRDPITDFIISGNSGVQPSDVTNIDLRAEWFFSSGDNFTVSLFSKDIDNPIEIFAETASNNEQRGQVENADTGEVAGIEIEWLVNLEFIGGFWSQFFVQGNATFLTTNEIDASNIQANIANPIRPLTGASDEIYNLVLGYDSDDGKHSAGLAFNTFSERVFISGDGTRQELFEQPFDSLDLTYTYFITDNFNLRFKARNLLDGENVITQEFEGEDIVVFEQTVGQSYSLGVNYRF